MFARRELVETLSWLRGVRAGTVVEWADAADLGERVAARGAGGGGGARVGRGARGVPLAAGSPGGAADACVLTLALWRRSCLGPE